MGNVFKKSRISVLQFGEDIISNNNFYANSRFGLNSCMGKLRHAGHRVNFICKLYPGDQTTKYSTELSLYIFCLNLEESKPSLMTADGGRKQVLMLLK